MKNVACYDIQNYLNSGTDIKNIINNIYDIIEKEFPKYKEWFLNKVVPELYTKKRNIIILCNDSNIVGFANLKKTNKEQKISNLYINCSYDSSKTWNIIIDKSIRWLNDELPTVIMSRKQAIKHISDISKRGWNITDVNDNNDIIINRGNEIESVIIKHFKKRKSI